ncbi:uncharacterized protein LOC135812119 isoform X1 [Sycon ciliatum]|uniref:uncharacterized protein LOC135812119 isoform X1 n=1 Tax=Sycon ciliatum TaxID=27933 RepID=UPI0031F6C057
MAVCLEGAAARTQCRTLTVCNLVHNMVVLCAAVCLHSATRATGSPVVQVTRGRLSRRADGKHQGSSLVCVSYREVNETKNVSRTISLVTHCANPRMPLAVRLACNHRYVQTVQDGDASLRDFNWINFTYTVQETKTVLVRLPGRASYRRKLRGNFHWIDWNSTLPLIKHPAGATYVRCEWRFVLKTKEEFRQDNSEQGPAARIHLFNKVWVRRAPNRAGCRRTDGRLTIAVQNVTGSKRFVERERYCGRRQLPGEQIKHFWPDTSVVTMSFRSSLSNARPVGPYGYFFSYRGDELINGCAYDCYHSDARPYDFCRNASLPAFLKISVDESRVRNYTVSEMMEGFAHAIRLLQDEAREYHCIQRYPVFKQLFLRGSTPNFMAAKSSSAEDKAPVPSAAAETQNSISY